MPITKDEVLKMDLKSIHAAIKNPTTSADMQQLLRDRKVVSYVSTLMLETQKAEDAVDAQIAVTIPPSTEELAAQATEMANTISIETPVVETPAAPVVPAPVVEAPVERKRIVREYQVRDEDGTPIGRPTHLEAWSLDEMLEKMQVAHENATRAFHRLKKQKLSFKENEPKVQLTPEQITAAATAALTEKDPSKAQDVIREILKTEFQKEELELKKKRDFQLGLTIGNQFRANHLHDYNGCEANQKMMGEYLKENNLEFTLDNVEAAFIDLTDQGKLVPVPKRGTDKPVVEVANPTPATSEAAPKVEIPPTVTPAAETTSVVTPPQVTVPVVAETTVTTPATANQPHVARRPGVNGGIAPGTLSAQRPGTPDPALARKEFLKIVRDMNADVMKAKLKNDPQFVKQLEANGIRVR